MSNAPFARLLSPGRIGTMETRNRIAVTAMGVSYAEADGAWGGRVQSFYEELAQGGAGLIITGATGVAWPAGGVQLNQLAISDDKFEPGVRATAEAVHRYGAKIAAQLHHGGPNSVIDMVEGRPVMVPSVPELEEGGYLPHLLEDELEKSLYTKIASMDFHPLEEVDIRGIVDQFASGAARAKLWGLDGVELHAGHGYILSAFLSPASNRRNDAYGGSIENRARLACDVMSAVREEVGKDFPVWVKIDSREINKAGIVIEDAIAAAKLLEKAGADAITVSAYHNTYKGKIDASSHTPLEPGQNLPFAAKIKAAVGIPIIASGRVEPELAEKTLAEGGADFISMGRKLLADPALPEKLVQGREKDIRPCIYCYICISSVVVAQPVRCAVNPDLELGRPPRSAASGAGKHIVVVGGGPGGMEAARRLAGSGASVTLFDTAPRLGGTLRFASLGYAANERLMDWLIEQVRQAGVDVRLNTAATAEVLSQLRPDAVVVATGAERRAPDIPGAAADHVFSGDDMRRLLLGEESEALKSKTSLMTRLATKIGAASGATSNPTLVREASRQWMPFGRRIAIIGGELVGLELAEFLAERGRQVAVIDDAAVFGAGLSIVRRVAIMDELQTLGVALHRSAQDVRIDADAVRFADPAGNAQSIAADHVIIAKGARGDLSVADALRSAGFAVHTVGDCDGVGYIDGAMRDAARVADVILGDARS